MKLKDCSTLWGVSVVHLKEHSKKYRLYSSLLYFIDMVIIVLLTIFMYNNNVNYQSYGFVIVAVCLFVHFTSYNLLNPEKWEAFKFYKRYSNYNVATISYDLDDEKLYSILYCLAFKRLKKGKDLDTYKELVLSACCENTNNAKKIMKYLQKYESNSGTVICKILVKGKNQYFIDFDIEEVGPISEDSNEELNNTDEVVGTEIDEEGDNEDGDDYTGAVEQVSTIK